MSQKGSRWELKTDRGRLLACAGIVAVGIAACGGERGWDELAEPVASEHHELIARITNGIAYGCDWRFTTSGLSGHSRVSFSEVTGTSTLTTGKLKTTYPGGASAVDAFEMRNGIVSGSTTSWRFKIPAKNIACDFEVDVNGGLRWKNCSNAVIQSCMAGPLATSASVPGPWMPSECYSQCNTQIVQHTFGLITFAQLKECLAPCIRDRCTDDVASAVECAGHYWATCPDANHDGKHDLLAYWCPASCIDSNRDGRHDVTGTSCVEGNLTPDCYSWREGIITYEVCEPWGENPFGHGDPCSQSWTCSSGLFCFEGICQDPFDF